MSNHLSAPASGAPWDNVLNVNGNSGVYIGGGWVLTAKHVYNTAVDVPVVHEGTDYTVDTALTLDFTDPIGVLATEVDLRLFRLTSTIPGLDSITLTSVILGNPVTMIGRGGSPRTKRWGTNNVELTDELVYLGPEGGPPERHITSFTTDYDTSTVGEAQANGGDSGGGTFYQDGLEWKIAGIMIAIDPNSSPQQTFHAQLSQYQTKIENHMALHGSAVPEPSSAVLLVIASFGFIIRRSRS